jgi:hypothetical protein
MRLCPVVLSHGDQKNMGIRENTENESPPLDVQASRLFIWPTKLGTFIH